MRAAIDRYDKKISRSLEPFLRKQWLSAGMKLMTFSASGLLWFPIYAVACLLANQQTLPAKAIIAGECIQLSLIIPLRHFTKRPRPRAAPKRFSSFAWDTFSFPSLHTSRACMIGGILYAFYPWASPVIGAIILLIAFSRLMLQKHYLSDIACGAAVGVFASTSALVCAGMIPFASP